jgi:hypothetical protein
MGGTVLVFSLLALGGCTPSHPFPDAPGEGGMGGEHATDGGTRASGGGAAGSGAMSGGPASSCTPGDIERCWESADGVPFAGEAPTATSTPCHAGERKCQGDGSWGACLGAVAPEASDTCDPGNDGNCNGTLNEGCTCTDGEKRACGSDVGNCEKGEQTCVRETWSDCVGATDARATDGCDPGDDGNCNGTANEGCECKNGETKSCGTDLGPCELGTMTCVNGVFPVACAGGIAPAARDTCEPGNDADCDGTSNEGCSCTGSGLRSCGVTKGACKQGMQSCTNGVLSSCSVTPTANDTCFANDDSNDTNCNGLYGDNCSCIVAEKPTQTCPDANGCGVQSCDGATGKWGACAGDTKLQRCSGATRQTCSAGGVWTNNPCPSGSVCRNNGADCKKLDEQPCTAASECDSGACTTYYVDADEDGYSPSAMTYKFCGTTKAGHVTTVTAGTDCNDNLAAIKPGAPETCDDVDNDCDGKKDFFDGVALGGSAADLNLGPTGNTRSQPEIAWSPEAALYGIAFEDDSAATDGVYFTTMTQAGSVGTAVKNVAGPSIGYAIHLVWGTDNFGLTWFEDGNVNFRTVSSTGGLGLIKGITNGALAKPQVARFGTGSWGIQYLDYATGFGLVRAKTLSANGTLSGEAEITTTNSNYGFLVATSGGFATATELNGGSAKASLYSTTFGSPATISVPGISPVLGRGPNGFAIAVSIASNKPKFYSYDEGGGAKCDGIPFGDTSFDPDDIVGTADGYVVVSGGTSIRGQQISSDCTLGPIFSIDSSAGDSVRISGGASGYGVIWETATGSKLKRRLFGNRFCN